MHSDSPRPHYTLTFAILALAGGSYALLQSLVAPALPEIQRDLHTSTASVTWVLTGYLLSASVATPIVGRLGDMFGKKRMLVWTLLVLALGTVIAGLASSLGLLLAGRVVQGVGGAVFPLAFGIIRDEFPSERVPGGIALISAILGIGAGLGIVLAGPLVQALDYHWLFWLPLIVIVIATIGAVIVIPESPVRSRGRIDWLGALLLSGWLVALLLGVSEGPNWGWLSARTVGLYAAAAVLFVSWVLAAIRVKTPLVDMRMMRLRSVWATNTTAILIGFGMFSSFVLVPQLVEMPRSTGFGFGGSITTAGLVLVPSTIAMLIFSPIAGRMATRVGSKTPLVAGTVFSAAAYVWLAVAHSQTWQLYIGTGLMGAGIGLAFASMANLIVEAVPREQTGVATGMNAIMRSIGGALGGQVAASIVTGTVAVDGLPREQGFVVAFIVCAASLCTAFAASLLVPGGRVAHVVEVARAIE